MKKNKEFYFFLSQTRRFFSCRSSVLMYGERFLFGRPLKQKCRLKNRQHFCFRAGLLRAPFHSGPEVENAGYNIGFAFSLQGLNPPYPCREIAEIFPGITFPNY